jgi:hypothetical protein
VLLVPVLPGSVLRSVEPAREREPPSQRVFPVAAGLGGALVLIAVTVVLLSGGGDGRRAAPVAAPSVAQPAPVVVHPSPTPARKPAPAPARPTAAERAHAAALRLAARLPVKVETAALLPSGGTVYVVGGSSSDGTPSNGIWQLDLRTRKLTAVGTFVEPLTGAAAATRDGVLYLAGGWTGEKLATGVLRWTPGQSSSLVTRLPSGLRGAHAAFVGSTLYVSGGSAPQAYAVDVGTGSVTVVSKVPPSARARSNLALLEAALG